MAGLLAYGTYLPYFRLQRQAIAATLGAGGGKGTRVVASYDEDATSMGVEAGRAAIGIAPVRPRALYFSTTSPGYLDKTNATAIHAALDLDSDVPAVDMGGAVRSGIGALRAALASSDPTLVVLSDVRTGLPGGADERDGGDAAVALMTGDGEGVVAQYLGGGSATAEFLDRWRVPGDTHSRVWEERFGEQAYAPLVEQAVTASKSAGIAAEDIDHLIVTGLHARAVRNAFRSFKGVKPEAIADDLSAVVGNTGVAHPGLLLASVLDKADPGQTIVLCVLADGCDVLVFRTTDAIARLGRGGVQRQIESGKDDLPYATFLTWRGLLNREPPRRPDPTPPAAPPSFRREDWKFAFIGSRCEACGTRHMPPQRVCVNCRAVDKMAPERLADVKATVATFTVDRLAFSLSPPVVVGVLDFDGGGRYQCELTDVDPKAVKIGDRVEMTFRRLYTANGVHNYFWKARPIRGGE
jgi:3-hydroxy-3-methylglutaryl CoA synthase/uncharacterized OB-fold protein